VYSGCRVSSDSILIDLPRIIALTREMLALAQAGEWDGLVVIEAQRRVLLDARLHGAKPNVLAACAGQLRDMLAMDNAIIALAEQAKEAVGEELKQFGKGRKALSAYSSNENY